jgi:hypothetical protein
MTATDADLEGAGAWQGEMIYDAMGDSPGAFRESEVI